MTRPDEELAGGDRERLESEERDLEAPVADLAEQSVSANPIEEPARARPSSLEVGEWDALEQSIVIDLEDEYDH